RVAVARRYRGLPTPGEPRPPSKPRRRRSGDELATLFETGVLYLRVQHRGLAGLGKAASSVAYEGLVPIEALCRRLGIERPTLYKRVKTLLELLPAEDVADRSLLR